MNQSQCPSCGQAIDANADNCPSCGAAIAAGEEDVIEAVLADASNPYAAASPEATAAMPVQPVGQSSIGDDAAVRMLIPVGRSVWAIAAGYFGLFSLVCFPAPIALILGLVALRDIKNSDGKKHGAGRAWFGVVMGAIFSIVLLVGIVSALVAAS